MTSIMDAEQRRELQRATRAEAARAKETERETARPPAEAAAALAAEEEVAIPKAPAIPAEAAGSREGKPSDGRPAAPVAVARPQPAPSSAWMVVAFLLLVAAVAFVLRS